MENGNGKANQIKFQYLKGGIEHFEAIEMLQDKLNYQPKDAESLVDSWDVEAGREPE